MNPLRRFWSFFHRPGPGMIGTPPSVRGVPVDAGLHALDFAHRYAEPMNYLVENRMLDLGIELERIGARKYGFPHRTFWPEEATGGGNVPGRRLTVDSGIFNVDLFKGLGPGLSSRWEKEPLRHRLDSIIAHEYVESLGASHEEAVARAADTELPISDQARRLLREIAAAAAETRGGSR